MKMTIILPSYFADVSSVDSTSCRGSECGSSNQQWLDASDVHDDLELKDEVVEDFEGLVEYVFYDVTKDETSQDWCVRQYIQNGEDDKKKRSQNTMMKTNGATIIFVRQP